MTTTRDGVTLMLPTEPDEELRAIFDDELARRGVALELAFVWRKFQLHGFEIRSRGHLEKLWRRWCLYEKPRRAVATVPPPAASEPAIVPQEAPLEPPASLPPPVVEAPAEPKQERPGPRSVVPVDGELSRRLERERLERLAREAAELRAAHVSQWANHDRDPDSWSAPSTMVAEVKRRMTG